MAKTIRSVLETVVGTLSDDSSITWTLQKLVRYMNDGQLDIHVARPDLFNTEQGHALVAGARQTLPVNSSKLINITHNTVGEMLPVTLIDRQLLDAQMPGWRSATRSLRVIHFMYDERQPKVFEVYPPAAVGASLRIEHAAIPVDLPIPAEGAALADVVGDINVPDLQGTALQHYLCHRAYAEGSEDGHMQLSKDFFALFSNVLGVEIESTKNVAPNKSSP